MKKFFVIGIQDFSIIFNPSSKFERTFGGSILEYYTIDENYLVGDYIYPTELCFFLWNFLKQ